MSASSAPSIRDVPSSAVRRALHRAVLDHFPGSLKTRAYVYLRLRLAPLVEVARAVPDEGKVLDLGCGVGLFSALLQLASPGRHVVGVDFDAARIAVAKETFSDLPHLQFHTGDVSSVTVDAPETVTLVDLLHHMPLESQDDLLRRVYEGLPPRGLLIVKDLETRPRWKYWAHYVQDSISYRFTPLRFRSREAMTAVLEGLGFDVRVISLDQGYPHPHLLYRCTKPARAEPGRDPAEPTRT